MNIEEIGKIRGSIMENIKLIRGKKVGNLDKCIARDCIVEAVGSLERKYIYRMALSSKDQVAREIYKVLREVETELFLYLEYVNNNDFEISEVYRKLTLFL